MFLFNDGKLLGFHMDFLSGKHFYRCRGIFFFKDFFYNEKPIIHLVLPILVRKISAIEKKKHLFMKSIRIRSKKNFNQTSQLKKKTF